MKSWRDVLPVHPAAADLPMLNEAELQELGEDIKANGLRVPVVLWSENPESKVFLLDGRNRLTAMESVGLPVVHDDWKGGGAHQLLVNYRHLVGAGGGFSALDGSSTTVDPVAFVMSANVRRRHLDAADKRKAIETLLRAKPEASNRAIAEQLKDDHKKVGRVRRKLEATGAVPQLKKTKGKDGKARTIAPKKPQVDVAEELEANRERIDKALKLPGSPGDSLLAKAAGVSVKTIKAAKARSEAPAAEPQTFITVASFKAELLRFGDEELRDLGRAIEEEIAERATRQGKRP
jgi:hypothetical protein